jgi:hypothetical protein
VTVTKPGTLFALTPTIRPKAASQEEALQKAGFTKVDVPEVQLAFSRRDQSREPLRMQGGEG